VSNNASNNVSNYLWPDGPIFEEASGVFKLGTDSVLLSHFVKTSNVKRRGLAADLGCGSGIISIILSWQFPELQFKGIEISEPAAALAVRNVKLNGLEERIHILLADLRNHDLLPAGTYDLVVSNPPYFADGSGKLHADTNIAAARAEQSCSLEDICKAAGHMTRWGGSFMLVHKPERLADIFKHMQNAGFEPKRMRFVQHKAASPPNIVLVEARRGGKPSLNVEAPLILTCEDGSDSDEVKMIYRR